MTVVFISVFCALTFLPALLSVIGNGINKFSLLKIAENQTSIWHRFAKFVMNHPIFLTIVALAILLVGLIPVRQMILTIPGTDSLPPTYPSRMAYEVFRDHFIPKNKREEKK